MHVLSKKVTQKIVPTIGVKQKDKGKEKTGGAHKKMKVHKVPPVYNITNDDMYQIGYQVRGVIEEAIKEETKRQEQMHQV